jgi:hypothetical protein
MNDRKTAILLLALGGLALASVMRAADPASDIAPPDVRRAIVTTAEKLAHPTPLPAIPPELAPPFSPPNFDKPDSSEHPEKAGDKQAAPAAPTDREVLAAVAAKIPTTGTIILGGHPLLISGTNRIEIGSRFTVVYNGQEYELELVAIDRTTFTVRYKGEEFTRPIKLGKSP